MKKILVLLLAVIMLLSCVACASKDDGGDNTTAGTGAGTDTDAAVTTNYEDILPDKNFDGSDYKILMSSQMEKFCFATEDSVSPVSETIYRTLLKVESKYGVDFKYKLIDGNSGNKVTFVKEILSAVMADQADTYDLVMGQALFCSPLVFDGAYHNLYGSEYLNTEADWYYQEINNNMILEEQIYGIAGSFNMDKIAFAMCMFYNKEMYKDLFIGTSNENIYDIVYNREWTLDLMNEMVAVAKKEDGNGIWDDSDTYGFLGCNAQFACMVGADIPGIEVTPDGTYELVYYSNRLIEAFAAYQNFLLKTEGVRNVTDGSLDGIFTNGRGLFMLRHVLSLPDFKDSAEFDIGVLPFPKYDDAQEDYKTYINRSELVYVPINADLEKATIVLEYLNYLFYTDVIPAYWEVSLQIRYTDDTNDAEMLDIVRSTCYEDFAYAFRQDLGDFYAVGPASLLLVDGGNVSSWWGEREDVIKGQLTELIDKYSSMKK